MIRLLIADDHKIVRDGLKRILAATADLQVAAEAASGDQALALIRAGEYDVALLDLSMPGLAGIDLIKRLRLEKPALKLLVLSMHGDVPGTTPQSRRGKQDTGRTTNRCRDGGAGDAHLGKRTHAKYEQRAEHDVECVGKPEHAHRDRGIASAAW